MARWTGGAIRSADDLARFEEELSLEARLPGPGILDVFVEHAAHQPDRTAITMLMSGADDERASILLSAAMPMIADPTAGWRRG